MQIYYLKGSQEKKDIKEPMIAVSASVKNLASETLVTESENKWKNTNIPRMTTSIIEDIKTD